MTISEKDGELGIKFVSIMAGLTQGRIGKEALENAKKNQYQINTGKSISALRNIKLGDGNSAIIIAAGPSIKRYDPIQLIKEKNFKGTIICTESALSYCLRNDIIPHLTVTLDPHPSRIVRWFGDPNLEKKGLDADDYYRRQDMDEAFSNELVFNKKNINLF